MCWTANSYLGVLETSLLKHGLLHVDEEDDVVSCRGVLLGKTVFVSDDVMGSLTETVQERWSCE